jgi:hypothetical protein
MYERGEERDAGQVDEPRGNLASDAELARQSDHAEKSSDRLRIRPINVFELARRVYSSKKTSLRTSRLFRN